MTAYIDVRNRILTLCNFTTENEGEGTNLGSPITENSVLHCQAQDTWKARCYVVIVLAQEG